MGLYNISLCVIAGLDFGFLSVLLFSRYNGIAAIDIFSLKLWFVEVEVGEWDGCGGIRQPLQILGALVWILAESP